MNISENVLSFFTGAAIVHVPLNTNAMIATEPYYEIGMFFAKSIIGGVVSVIVAHIVHLKSKNQNKSNEHRS